MQKYYGAKRIKAVAMTRAAYNEYRGWELPSDENGSDEGYLVEYLDSPNGNHPSHSGYISWSPQEQFEKAYRPVGGLTFGLALEVLRSGGKVTREGWNGKGMHLELQNPTDLSKMTSPYIFMKTADDNLVPWVASQTDLLAEDWIYA